MPYDVSYDYFPVEDMDYETMVYQVYLGVKHYQQFFKKINQSVQRPRPNKYYVGSINAILNYLVANKDRTEGSPYWGYPTSATSPRPVGSLLTIFLLYAMSNLH